MSGVPNYITQQILAPNTCMRGKLVLDVLEPMVVTCNIGCHLCSTLWEWSKSDLLVLPEARGAALALQQSTQYMTWCF